MAKPKVPTRIERSAGGFVWRKTDTGPQLLLIRDSHNNWALPKGRIEQGETPEVAARREIAEETGLTKLAYTADLGESDFWFEDKWEVKGERVHKFVHYYLYELVGDEPVVTSEEEHVLESRWVARGELDDAVSYASLKPVVAATREALAHVER